jgi:hypothetical protein
MESSIRLDGYRLSRQPRVAPAMVSLLLPMEILASLSMARPHSKAGSGEC